MPTTLPLVRARRIQFLFKEDFQSVVLDNYKSMDSFILNTFLEQRLADVSLITLNRLYDLKVFEGTIKLSYLAMGLLFSSGILLSNTNLQ